MKKIPTIGYASGIAANKLGCGEGPFVLQKSSYLQNLNLQLQWLDILKPTHSIQGLAAIPVVAELCERLAEKTLSLAKEKKSFLILGGDHTAAIGNWSGVSAALQKQGSLGLIWFDAHMDSHTPETSYSGNVHGMPLASLMGYGAASLTKIMNANPKLLPENVCLIGTRSFEAEEAALLKKLNVRIYFMPEIKQRGMQVIMQEALALVQKNTAGYGISLDIDVVDPKDAPGVGTPAPGGLSGTELCQALNLCHADAKLQGIEIVEFNPELDKDKKTEKLIFNVIDSVF